MAFWDEIDTAVGRAVRHFKAMDGIACEDAYVAEMAIRHALQCGEADIGAALAILRRRHAKGAGYSLLSPQVRSAYLSLRALAYAEFSEPSSVDDELLRPAIEAARVMAECLQADFDRIRKEVPGA